MLMLSGFLLQLLFNLLRSEVGAQINKFKAQIAQPEFLIDKMLAQIAQEKHKFGKAQAQIAQKKIKSIKRKLRNCLKN